MLGRETRTARPSISIPRISRARSPWTNINHLIVTNNIIRNVARGLGFLMDGVTTSGNYTCLPEYDVLVQNNLFENISGGVPFTGKGNGISFTSSSQLPPGWNIVIDHNTLFNSVDFIGFDSQSKNMVATGLTVTNNVGDHDIGTGGSDITNDLDRSFPGIRLVAGGYYTSAPSVSFSGGGATTQATGHTVYSNDQMLDIQLTSAGHGYTVPPLSFTNGGGTALPHTPS